MQTISLASALHASQIATTAPWHILLTLYPDPENSPEVVLRLAREPEDVTYKGDLYVAFNFDFDAINDEGKGQLTTLSLRVCNVNRMIHQYMEQYNGGVGATVELRVVSDNDMTGDPSIFMQFQITDATADVEWCTFTLGADNPMRQSFPRFIYVSNFCIWDYKGAQCAYAGGLATCSKTLDGTNGCRAHVNSARFGGFPGIETQGFRAAMLK